MKKSMKQITAALIAAVLTVSLYAGCNRNGTDEQNGSFAGTSGYVYVLEYVNLPENVTDIANMTMIGDRFVFSTQQYIEEIEEWGVKLYSMNYDGSDLMELENFAVVEKPEDAPDDTLGTSYIYAIFSDLEGNIWVSERCNFYYFDLPDDFVEEEDGYYGMYAYFKELSNESVIRKLDSTGAEILRVNLSSIAESQEYFYISSVNIDKDGLLYIGSDQTIFVIDDSGTLKFTIEVQNWVEGLIRLSDGTVAFYGWTDEGRQMRRINSATSNWGEEVTLPTNAYNFYVGAGKYDIVFVDNENLFGIDSNSGESELILNFINSDVSGNSVQHLAMLPDGRVLLSMYTWDYTNPSGGARYELIILSSVPADSIPPKTVLTLACYGVDWNLRNSIVDFNKTNAKYRIQVNDYSVYREDDNYYAGLTRLSTEIISGNVPDMLLASNLPISQYIAKGLIEDLYPFIDADPEYNRSQLVESALRATEIDGRLYQLFSTFYVNSLWGNPSVLGDKPNWDMDEFLEVIRAHPEATSPFGLYITKSSFLWQTVMLGMDRYIDWAAGTTHFDTDEFIKVLEYANTLSAEIEYDYENWVSEEELIATGKQIMRMSNLYNLQTALMEKARFGGELVYKGFPTSQGSGNVITIEGSMAMTTACKDKEGAWEFMRHILAEITQRDVYRYGFPINKASFDEMFNDIMTQEYHTDEDGNETPIPKVGYYPMSGGYQTFSAESYGFYASVISRNTGYGYYEEEEMVYIYAMTQEEADQILMLFDTMSGVAGRYDESLMNIITEGAENYFNNRATAQDAARVIQSRASLYIAEQS